MRCLLALLVLTACSESRSLDDFDSGPAPVDVVDLDVPSSDAAHGDVFSRGDTGARDAGSIVDSGPIFDGGPDTSGPTDCMDFCWRTRTCIKGEVFGDCDSLCRDIRELVTRPACELLADNLYHCVDDVPCGELEYTLDEGGVCRMALEEFRDGCGDL